MQRNPAAAGLDRKFGALYDKIYREDVIAEAWKRVRANKGAPGVDRQDFDYIENVIGGRACGRWRFEPGEICCAVPEEQV